MRRATDVRERWITEVLRTDAINNSAKVVLFAMYRHMTESGRVSYPRERLAAEVGFKSEQRVTDRIREAKDAGLIDVIHPGHRGMTAVYEAQLPRAKGPRSGVPNSRKVTGDGVPFSGSLSAGLSDPKGPRDGVANARGTYKNRDSEPAPVGSRVEPEHLPTSKAAATGEWQPTPLTSLPSLPRTEVA